MALLHEGEMEEYLAVWAAQFYPPYILACAAPP